MVEGKHKRIQPDLVKEIEQYSGGSFSEKMVKWKEDVNTMSHDDVDDVVREVINDLFPGIMQDRR